MGASLATPWSKGVRRRTALVTTRPNGCDYPTRPAWTCHETRVPGRESATTLQRAAADARSSHPTARGRARLGGAPSMPPEQSSRAHAKHPQRPPPAGCSVGTRCADSGHALPAPPNQEENRKKNNRGQQHGHVQPPPQTQHSHGQKKHHHPVPERATSAALAAPAAASKKKRGGKPPPVCPCPPPSPANCPAHYPPRPPTGGGPAHL